MKKTKSIKLNKDFKRLYYRGKSVVKSNVVVYVLKNREKTNRLGLTCGKSIGKAVRRNRVKRLMREGYRLLEDRLSEGFDIVLVARTRSVSCKEKHILKDLETAFDSLGILEK
jgi:ribonuclease P protein component